VVTGDRAIDTLVFLLIRLLLISAIVLFFGVLRVLSSGPILSFTLVLLVVLLAKGEHRHLLPFSISIPRIWMVAFGTLLLRAFIQSWCFAPYNADCLSYHLPKVAQWIHGRSIITDLGPDSHSTFPAGFELLEAWWTVFNHHDVLIEFAGIEWWIIGGVAVYGLAQYAGLSRNSSYFGAFFYALTPGIAVQSTSCLNDGAVASALLASLLLACRGESWALLVMSVGLGIGIKPVYAFALPPITILYLVVAGLPNRNGKAVGTLSVALAGSAILVGAFWYIRNLLWLGNPIYPIASGGLSDAFGNIQLGFNLSSLRLSFVSLVEDRVWDRRIPMSPVLPHLAGWGSVNLALGMPGLLTGAQGDVRIRRLAWTAIGSAALIFSLVAYDPWNARFVLFLAGLLSVGAAWLVARMPAVGALAGIGLFINFILTMLPAEIPPNDFKILWSRSWTERSTLVTTSEVPRAITRIGCFVDTRKPVYCLFTPDFSRTVVYLRPSSSQELLEMMKGESLKYLYAEPELPAGRSVLLTCIKRGSLVRRGEGVFELSDEAPLKSP